MFILTLLVLSVCSGVTSTLSTYSLSPCPLVSQCTVSNGLLLFWVIPTSPGRMQNAHLLSAFVILNWHTNCAAKWPEFSNERRRRFERTMIGLPSACLSYMRT